MVEAPGVKALRVGRASPASVLQARALSIVLPESGEVLTFDDLVVEALDFGYVALHSGDGASTTSIVIVIAGEDVVGTLHHDGAVYGVHPLGDGFTAVYLYDAALINPHYGPDTDVVVPDAEPRDPESVPPHPGAGKQDRGDVIDLLVVYTARAKRNVGNVNAALAQYLLESNMMLRNSGVFTRWRLAHSYETSYVEHPDSYQNLERLRRPDDGFLDEALELRDQHRADIVVLLYAENRGYCHGRAYRPNHSYGYHVNWAFGVVGVGVSCSAAAAASVFSHEVAHVQGAGHNPEEMMYAEGRYPYGHGLCNVRARWRTVMAYNTNARCPRIIPYFSNPKVRYRGLATGDPERRDNARVLNETAFTVANFRPRVESATGKTHRLPLVPGADESGIEGFVRIRNRSPVAGEVAVYARDDTGAGFGPAYFRIDAGHTGGFDSGGLEEGSPDRGLPVGIGDGTGSWRLELVTDLDIEARAYVRTTGGFVTEMHQLAQEHESIPNTYLVPFFNPASNLSIRSLLRVANPNPVLVDVELRAWDNHDDLAEGDVFFTLSAGAAIHLTSQQLEAGDEELFFGRFGDGEGKWRLEVIASHPLEVMSLLATRSGHLTNLSR